MFLDEYVHPVTDQLSAAAALGDDRTRQIAATLAATADPAVRLAILGALSAAADEITATLLDSPDAPLVAVELDGDEVRVRVTRGAPAEPAPPVRPAADGDPSARISLRLSDALKADVEAAATHDGVSVNTWLVRAAAAALTPDRRSAIRAAWTEAAARPHDSHRITGWING